MEQLEYRTFLLHVAKELTTKQFGELKFVLKGYISSGACETMEEVCQYFEELERRLFLTPTNLGILKVALNAIGRPDLVEEIEEKEPRFTKLFSPQVKAGDNLEPKEYDKVCDGIEKEAGNLKALHRSGQNTPDLQKQLKSTVIDNEDEVQLQEFTDVLPNSDNLQTVVPTYGKQKGGPPHPTAPGTGSFVASPRPQWLQTDKEVPSGMAFDEAQLNSSEDVDMTSEEDALIASNTKGEVNNKPTPKEPGESTEIDGTSAEKTTSESAGATSSPAETPLNMSSHQEPGNDCVTDGNENQKEGESHEVVGHKKTTSQGAECHSSQNDYGGARPKQKQGKPAVSSGSTKQNAKEQVDQAECHSSQNDYGGARPKQKQGKPAVSSGSTKQNAKEQVDQVTSTDPHGTMVKEELTVSYPASNAKQPTEDECLSPTVTKGTSQPTDVPMGDTEEREPSSKKAKSTQHVPGQKPSIQKSQHHTGVLKGFPHNEGAAGSMDPGLGPYSLYGLAAPQTGMASEAQQLQMLQQLYGGLSASAGPSCQLPMLSRSYDKEGYSVSISHGTLCDSSYDKGVVMMESGAQFFIAIANNNAHAAEVDITFGGVYLGVWVVEAKRPLVVEGSAWAKGRLRYFSLSDRSRPPTPNELSGELNGKIELEFKPEILMLKLHVQHVRNKELHEIFMPDYKTATVGDLKKVINQQLREKVSCLIKNNSEILNEDKTMSSLALENSGEVIQALHMKEELLIASIGKDPVMMMVDPFDFSPEKIKDFIKENIKIPVAEQRVCFQGQNIDELDSLIDVLVKSKETPVLQVDQDRLINFKVCLPDGREHEVEMNWFETVNDLKKKMEELQICESDATLKFNDSDISNEGRKQLIDLQFRNQSEVTVHPKEHRSTHRGSHSTRGFGLSGCTRGFGNEIFSANSTLRGDDDNLSGAPSALSRLPSGPEDMQHDKEGIAMLCGDEENVSSHFEKDQETWKFSKEWKVTLIIQLIDERTGATGYSASSLPAGRHPPKYIDGPMSTPTPPPVPE